MIRETMIKQMKRRQSEMKFLRNRKSLPPFVRGNETTSSFMLDVIIALIPILLLSVYYYGIRPLMLTIITVLTCIISEYIFIKMTKRQNTIGDLSAIVTGIITAMLMPSSAPLIFGVIGGLFAIGVAKWAFGGIGQNPFNPAAAAIAFLIACFPNQMFSYVNPFTYFSLSDIPSEFVKSATAQMKVGSVPDVTITQMLFGDFAGPIGATSILVLLCCALYLIYRRVISFKLTAGMLLACAIYAALFPRILAGRFMSVSYELMSGMLLFVAIFVLNDPVTSPNGGFARFFYGFGCGIITMLLRNYGGLEEGAIFAILIMNIFALSFDKTAWISMKKLKGWTGQ
jgi:Na+-translocating ferredoxin:NAD+ oxidoreductase subunit D